MRSKLSSSSTTSSATNNSASDGSISSREALDTTLGSLDVARGSNSSGVNSGSLDGGGGNNEEAANGGLSKSSSSMSSSGAEPSGPRGGSKVERPSRTPVKRSVGGAELNTSGPPALPVPNELDR
jgi:hypothetical protein